MIFGGLQKHSLIDYPGCIACVLFTKGCNFRCPFCHNPELVIPKDDTPESADIREKDVYAFLNKRKGLLDGVVITGGEPTLHSEIETVCSHIKNMGFKIKIDTNGSQPDVLQSLFHKKLIDYIAMDIKTNLSNYPTAAGTSVDLCKIKKSIGLIMNSPYDYEFRTTCVKGIMSKTIAKDIGKLINGAQNYILQPLSRNPNVLDPSFFKKEDRFFTRNELLSLKEIVKTSVEKCELR